MRFDLQCSMLCSVYRLWQNKAITATLNTCGQTKGNVAVCKHCISCLEVSKYYNSVVFWELCMCCQHDEHSHNIYVTTTTKDRSKKCFRGFKVCSDYEHTAKGGNSLPSDVLTRISKKPKIRISCEGLGLLRTEVVS